MMDTAFALVLATSVMALGAITFSALSLAFQRSHSRKSVRPFCNVNQRTTETGITLSIQNAGMGPMRIHKVVLLSKEEDSTQAELSLQEAFPAETKTEVRVHPLDGYVLAPLQEVELFRCVFDTADSEGMTIWRNKHNGNFLEIIYSDIYDDFYEKKEALNLI